MKKSILLLLSIFVVASVLGADADVANETSQKKEGRFDISFSQGIAWGRSEAIAVPRETPPLGFVFDATFRFKLSDTRHLSIGYSRQYNGRTIHEPIYLPEIDMEIRYHDFDKYVRRHFLSLTYDTRLTPHIEVGAGLSYMLWGEPNIGVGGVFDEYGHNVDNFISVTNRRVLRSDDSLHVTAFARASFPINDYVELGVRACFHLGIIGFQSVMLQPGLRVKL